MRFILFTLFLLTFCWSCDKEDDAIAANFVEPTSCEEGIFIDDNLYNTAPADEFFYLNAAIEGDCLTGTLQYGGGCKEVDFKFVSKRPVNNDLMVVATRISLDDDDNCEALVLHEFSYELKGLQVPGTNQIILQLQGLDETLIYNY